MKVLLAEDDAVTREAVTTLLEGEGYQVQAAEHGAMAWDCWQQGGSDLVLLDIMMPRLNGYEVCRRIRAADPRVPVIFLSAKSEEIDVVLGLELGADEFVRKPFGARELLARVQAVVRRARPESPAEIAFGPWRIFPKCLRAEGPAEVELTLREVKLLQLLHRHRGEVVSRDELLNRCWGLEYYPESRTLDQHVLNLRKKLEADPSDPQWIRTVRGAGYRMPE
ncbi:response regulator transcription factor [Haloferula sargassicola]|uniref:Alkaline phosphatase synthesis transcriptional regulatory protein SphR n=1 Tax=Haloferula sargassicola TaxID=490096 RepID=A0ABP9UPW4_9BACT